MSVIPPSWEEEIGRIMVQGQPGQNVSETHLSICKLSMMVYICHLSYMEGSLSEAGPVQKCNTLPEN
jgi:hypothetical protein